MKIGFRYFDGPLDWGYVQSKVPIKRVEDTCGLIAVDMDTGKQIGAAIFDNFLNDSAQLTLIMDNSMLVRRGFLNRVYDFIFNEHRKNYCYALVAANNRASIKLTERVGYREKMRIPNGYLPNVDFIVYELHRSQFYKSGLKEVA